MRATRLRATPAFCPVCTAEDINRLGFSYWRRAPQVQGVNFCSKHCVGIVDRCIACGDSTYLSELPDLTCGSCHTPMMSQYLYRNSIHDRVMLAFATAVEKVYLGAVPGPLNARAALNHFNSYHPKKNPLFGADLWTYVENVAGKDFLQQLGLSYSPREKFPWPTLLYADSLVIG